MAIIVGVKFKNTNKVYYFNPNDINFDENDGVIVETARGLEYGIITIPNKEVDEKEIVSPLKPVVRKATDEDLKKVEKNNEDRINALKVIKEKVVEMKLAMKMVDAEYTFDRTKLIFYFTSESRVDFRELVRNLASIFKVRIELRQIYERDDTKMRGALASCGRPCCCTTHLPEFEKVSIKMAKLQGLSLNPQKISGVCGRLMCCLKYENEYYAETLKMMPKIGTKVKTPDGEGYVEDNDLIKQTSKIKVMLKDGSFDFRTYNLTDINIGETSKSDFSDNIKDKNPDNKKQENKKQPNQNKQKQTNQKQNPNQNKDGNDGDIKRNNPKNNKNPNYKKNSNNQNKNGVNKQNNKDNSKPNQNQKNQNPNHNKQNNNNNKKKNFNPNHNKNKQNKNNQEVAKANFVKENENA